MSKTPEKSSTAGASAASTGSTSPQTSEIQKKMKGAPRISQYSLDICIGSGGFGRVHLATDTTNGRRVAIKVVQKEMLEKTDTKSYFLRECQLSTKLTHVYIVKAIEFIEHINVYGLVLELAPGGELFDKIIERQRFPQEVARQYFQQLCSAVCYIHGQGIVHRDIKAENLLVGGDGELKLCDFGLARYVFGEGKKMDKMEDDVIFMSLAGSPDYVAPEVIAPQGYKGTSCDIWSIAVVLFFMICGYLPFASGAKDERQRTRETQERIAKGEWNHKSRHLTDPRVVDLLHQMFIVDPEKRATIREVILHPWVQEELPEDISMDMKKNLAALENSGVLLPNQAGLDNSPLSGLLAASSKNEQGEVVVDADVVRLITKAFKSCNVGGTGKLSRREIRDVLIKLNKGNEVPDEDVDQFLNCFDLGGGSGDGRRQQQEASINSSSFASSSFEDKNPSDSMSASASSASASSAGFSKSQSPSQVLEPSSPATLGVSKAPPVTPGVVSEKQFQEGWSKLGPWLATKGVPIEKLADMFHFDLESKLVGELREAFEQLDIENKGVISVESLMRVDQLQLSREQAEQLLKVVDADLTNTITFENFVQAVTRSDVLNKHPIVSRLQRLDKMFMVIEKQTTSLAISSGFTVAGFREQILKKLNQEAFSSIRTKFMSDDLGLGGGTQIDETTYITGEVLGPDGAARLLVGVRLQPSVAGFTRLIVYRIMGKTPTFHEWFRGLRMMLHKEISQVVEDTAVVGESEWM